MKILTTAALSLIALSGCTREVIIRETAPTVAPTTTESAPTTTEVARTTVPVLSDEEMYIDDVRMQTSLYGMSDADMIRFGYLTCQVFDEGGTSDDIALVIASAVVEGGLSEEDGYDFATAAGLAVLHLCPEYSSLI